MNNLRYLVLVMIFASTTVFAETYTYDAAGRLTGVSYDDGSHITYKYDANSNLLAVETSVPSSLKPGDLDGDGVLDFNTDFPEFLKQFGSTVTPGTPPDFDGDGIVGIVDFSIFLTLQRNIFVDMLQENVYGRDQLGD